jgi:predicted metal-dependent hydrolase
MIVDGTKIKVVRKNIKNVHLYVKPPKGDVTITCPPDFSNENVRFFARSKLPWILKKKEEEENHPRQTKREYVTGETVYLWGKGYYLVVKCSQKKYEIKLSSDSIQFTVRKGSTIEQRESAMEAWFRKILRQEINLLLPKWEKKTGLQAASFRIEKMITRWGSCNQKRESLLFNLFLVQKPKDCLNYVILHELAHTVEGKHNKKFVAILDKFMPNWVEIKRTLNSSISSPWED